ncbi:MAG: PTS sugar transporter subunit IIB [Erysipelotrichaceae bacterium]|nr:PTS sugar transporter subunit IIB [Erysipelotrichaceae bacterium]
MKILLVCNLGMSTSMLVQRMEVAAKEQNIDAQIMAVPFTEAEEHVAEWDVILLGPQVRHQLKAMEKKAAGKTPVAVIDMRDYGMMNGEKVLQSAIKIIEENK